MNMKKNWRKRSTELVGKTISDKIENSQGSKPNIYMMYDLTEWIECFTVEKEVILSLLEKFRSFSEGKESKRYCIQNFSSGVSFNWEVTVTGVITMK